MPAFAETSAQYTAVRTSFSPDLTHIVMLLENDQGAAPTFYIWNVAYPTIELTGSIKASGHIAIK